jgi:hypothetical protein
VRGGDFHLLYNDGYEPCYTHTEQNDFFGRARRPNYPRDLDDEDEDKNIAIAAGSCDDNNDTHQTRNL